MRKPKIPKSNTTSPFTLDKAIDRWLLERRHKRSIDDDAAMLKWWLDKLGPVKLELVRAELIQWYVAAKAKEASPSRANRYLAAIRAMLNAAANEWRWLDRVPKLTMYKEPKGRVRYLTKEEVTRLLAELPDHHKPLVMFALATGLRQHNCLRMTWQQIDLARKVAIIPGAQMKNKRDFGIPLNDDAMAALALCQGKHRTWVFTHKGQRMEQANNDSWRKALVRAGISDYRWHDNRHTWASTLIQNGVPLHALQALGGWESSDMVQRYAHLSPDHLHQYAAMGNGLTTQSVGATTGV